MLLGSKGPVYGKKVKIESEVIILSVGCYDFEQSDGKRVSGCKVMYYPVGSIDTPLESDRLLGAEPCKETFPLSFFDRAKEVGIPCRAKVTYVMRQSQGKQVLAIGGLDFLPNKTAAKDTANGNKK